MSKINEIGGNPYFSNNVYRFPHENSLFDFDYTYNGSFMMGMVIPLGAPVPVIPNQWLSLDLNGVLRTGTALVAPILDNMYVDVVSVFVPWRIIWNHYPQWLGENDQTAFNQTNTYQLPNTYYFGAPYTWPYRSNGKMSGSTGPDLLGAMMDNGASYKLSSVSWSNYYLNCHFMLGYNAGYRDDVHPGSSVEETPFISVLEHRGYYCLWNEYFREPDWQRPVLFSKTDTGLSGEFGYVMQPFTPKDTNGTAISSLAQATPGASITDFTKALLMPANRFRDTFYSLKPKPQAGDGVTVDLSGLTNSAGKLVAPLTTGTSYELPGAYGDTKYFSNVGVKNVSSGVNTLSDITANPGASTDSSTLYANLSSIGLAINNLRAGVMLQNFQDVLIRGDQRAPHIIEQLFGITPEGLKCDRPLLLHHSRHQIGVNQVVATSDSTTGAGGATSHLGETGAYSVTGLSTSLFTERFSEHGFVYNCVVVRSLNKYFAAIPEQFRRLDKFDHFWPTFDKIGMVPVYGTSINAQTKPDLVLGYQDGWYSYKAQRSGICGMLDANIADSYSFYTVAPLFSVGFNATNTFWGICQGPEGLDRALLANHEVCSQFLADIRIQGKNGLPMSVHSLPTWLAGRF